MTINSCHSAKISKIRASLGIGDLIMISHYRIGTTLYPPPGWPVAVFVIPNSARIVRVISQAEKRAGGVHYHIGSNHRPTGWVWRTSPTFRKISGCQDDHRRWVGGWGTASSWRVSGCTTGCRGICRGDGWNNRRCLTVRQISNQQLRGIYPGFPAGQTNCGNAGGFQPNAYQSIAIDQTGNIQLLPGSGSYGTAGGNHVTDSWGICIGYPCFKPTVICHAGCADAAG